MVGYIENPPVTRESDKFMLRLPDGMRDRIKAAADANNRSMNAEIVATLRAAYPEPDLDEATREILEKFYALPKEAQDKFLNEYIRKYPEKAIQDGIIPGASSSAP